MSELFVSETASFVQTEISIYSKREAVSYLVKDLLWGEKLHRKLRFVLVKRGTTKAILDCTSLNQSKLIEVLGRTIKDGRVISLIHKYLRAGVVVKHSYRETAEGVPQGGPLSPLLSNIMLNELDKELTQKGHKFVRYADDLMIFCKSK